ncbi:MAG TPA: YkoF family thiamine/hydroxymethylpyrimidine-binding protein [Steroidobacteraceae bacterium]|nr:YkoF family thiamine/hydroxymethylpyrimidine-binding protein [Steroidobacteraceae bacterium]
MDIAVEISLYPLAESFIPPIKAFLGRLQGDARLKVVTSSLSTQIVGKYEDVFGALEREMRTSFAELDKAVFILKVFGPLAAPGA